jgi:uncharacterized protein YbbK (DUF523 family)
MKGIVVERRQLEFVKYDGNNFDEVKAVLGDLLLNVRKPSSGKLIVSDNYSGDKSLGEGEYAVKLKQHRVVVLSEEEFKKEYQVVDIDE